MSSAHGARGVGVGAVQDVRRVLVVGDDQDAAEQAVEAAGLEVVRRTPDLVLCHGGDGTLLRAERMVPGVPKLPVRVGRGASLCPRHDLAAVLRRFRAGELELEALEMLELRLGTARLHALNDVVLRNENPALALRFRVFVDGSPVGPETTGDGLVVATPFGSTGYFHSITRRGFGEGLGIAFNNCTFGEREPLLLPADARVRVQVVRGPGVLVHDNDTRTVVLREGHGFEVQRSERRALVHGLDALACQDCLRHDDKNFNPH